MSKKSTSSGVSILGVLLIVFIVLKLTRLIAWRWVWVLSPLWAMLFLALIGAIAIVFALLEDKK